MATLAEARKRDFISQMAILLENEKTRLSSAGFDPAAKLALLNEKNATTDQAEIEQQLAAAKAKEATKWANKKLDEAYREASNVLDLVSGLLGKEDELVKKMRKFRK